MRLQSRGIEVVDSRLGASVFQVDLPERLGSVNDCARGEAHSINLRTTKISWHTGDVYFFLSCYVKSLGCSSLFVRRMFEQRSRPFLELFFIILVNKSRAHSLLCPQRCMRDWRVMSSRYNYLSAPTRRAWNFLSMFEKWKSRGSVSLRGDAPWWGEII
jgi:hypothetical protein